MLSEGGKCYHKRMIDARFRVLGHLIVVLQPAFTEFTCFSGSKREGCVKAAYGTEAICCQRQIVSTQDRQAVFQTVLGHLERHECFSWLGMRVS
jgi:hypothetical protein